MVDLYCWLNASEYIHMGTNIERTVEKFLQGQCAYQPSWRALIFALDGIKLTYVANRIRHYAELVQGRYMLCDWDAKYMKLTC